MKTMSRLVVIIVAVWGLAVPACLKQMDRGLDEQTIEGEITPVIPPGWAMYGAVDGQDAFDFICGYDTEIRHGGAYSATIMAVAVAKDDQGRLTQRFAADGYAGRRVRFAGYMKTNRVNGWAGLWMRVDTMTRQWWAFDDMEDQAVSGTTDWERYEIVLDVPADAAVIYLGVHLYGRGQVWLDDCSFETVGDDVPTSDGSRLRGGHDRRFAIPQFLDDEPVNLDFEETETL